MPGADGHRNENLIKITWNQFQEWQRWDEFRDRSDNPPMTVDMTFFYLDRMFHLDMINHEYVILTADWKTIAANKNFLKLVNSPIEEWNGKSFHDLVEEFLFVD